MILMIDVWEEVLGEGEQTYAMRVDGEGFPHAHLSCASLGHFDYPVPLRLARLPWRSGGIERDCRDGTDSIGEKAIAIDDVGCGAGTIGKLTEGKQTIDEIAWRKRHLHGSVTSAIEDCLKGLIG
jgi:hypothetical protein